MQSAVASFGSLTQVQADAWTHAANLHKRSKYGVGFTLSGQNLYIGHYIAMKKIGETPISAPTIFSGSPAVVLPTVGDDVAGQKEITGFTGLDTDDVLIVKTTPCVPVSVGYKPSGYSNYTFVASGFAGNQALSSDYPASGETYKFFVQYSCVNKLGAISGTIEGSISGTMV